MVPSEELSIYDNALTGKIPSEIGQCTALEDMSFDTNQFSGTIPTIIGLMTSLNWLYLNYNELTGTIPSEIALLRTSLSKSIAFLVFPSIFLLSGEPCILQF